MPLHVFASLRGTTRRLGPLRALARCELRGISQGKHLAEAQRARRCFY